MGKESKSDTSGIRTHARRLVPKTSALDHSAIVSSKKTHAQNTNNNTTQHTLHTQHTQQIHTHTLTKRTNKHHNTSKPTNTHTYTTQHILRRANHTPPLPLQINKHTNRHSNGHQRTRCILHYPFAISSVPRHAELHGTGEHLQATQHRLRDAAQHALGSLGRAATMRRHTAEATVFSFMRGLVDSAMSSNSRINGGPRRNPDTMSDTEGKRSLRGPLTIPRAERNIKPSITNLSKPLEEAIIELCPRTYEPPSLRYKAALLGWLLQRCDAR